MNELAQYFEKITKTKENKERLISLEGKDIEVKFINSMGCRISRSGTCEIENNECYLVKEGKPYETCFFLNEDLSNIRQITPIK